MKLIKLSIFIYTAMMAFHIVYGQDKQYTLTTDLFNTWEAARQDCENNFNEGVLATFDTITDIQNIHMVCNEVNTEDLPPASNFCWIGFFSQNDDGVYRFIDDGEIVDDEPNDYWYYYTDGDNMYQEPTGAGFGQNCGVIIRDEPVDNSLADFLCTFQTAPFYGVCEFQPTEVVSTTSDNGGMEDDSDSDSESAASSESDSNENAAKLNREISLEHENEDEDEDEVGNGYDMNMTIGFSKATWFDLWCIFGICMVFNFVMCMGLMRRKKGTGYVDNDSLPNSV